MADLVRIGVVGCGSVSSKYLGLAEQLKMRGLATVVAACDIDESRRDYARSYGIERFTRRYEELLAMDDVDLVLVLTSMPAHGPIVRAALSAGKNVLVEKPMAVTLEEADTIVKQARASKGFLLPAPHVVLSQTYQTMWRRIHNGDIGDVKLARAMYGWAGPWWGKWFYQPGGGVLFDLGVYNVTSLTGLLGPCKRVTALAGTAIKERIAEGEMMKVEAVDNAHVLMDFGNAVYAVVTTGFTIQAYRCPAIEIYGTTGTIQMMGDDWDPNGYELWQNGVGAWQVYGETDPTWPWVDGLRHAVECIRTGTRPIITPEHSYHVLEIMIKAQEAGRDGQARDIVSTFSPPEFLADGSAIVPAHLAHDRTD